MGPSFTSVVLVDHNFKALTDRFLIETTPDDLIFHLEVKVKEERPDELSPYRRSDVRVWKTKGTKAINLSSEESMPEILSTVDINDKNTIQKLSEEVKLAELGLSNFQSLLVQLPGTSHIFILLAVSSYSMGLAGVKHDGLVGDPIIREVDPGYVLSPLMKGWKYCPGMSVLASLVAAITDPVLSSMQDTDSESLRNQPYVGKFNADLALIRRLVAYSPTVYRMQYVSANHAPSIQISFIYSC